MTNVRAARILKHSLSAVVNRTIKEQYGDNYRSNATGNVFCVKEGEPFETTVGTWHIKDNTLYVEVIDK